MFVTHRFGKFLIFAALEKLNPKIITHSNEKEI